MQEAVDKGFLALCCLVLVLCHAADPFAVVPLMIAVLLSAACSAWDRSLLRAGGILLLCALGIPWSGFMLFLPLCLYDAWLTPQAFVSLAALIPLALGYITLGLPLTTGFLLTCGASFLLKWKTSGLTALRLKHTQLRDSAAELSLLLTRTNRELLKGQDEQVHTARLTERNRIAREIHDSVGHLLSSAILQLGALLALVKDPSIKESLTVLRTTLAQGMDSIRQSVHGLNDESIDLQGELNTLIKGFTFCQASLDYDVETGPVRQVKYAFLAIVKEALANVIKHSSATRVTVTVREHPALYQLDIRDNGTNAAYDPSKASGIGVANMVKRAEDLNGRIHIDTQAGFHIFLSVPKELKP